MAFLVLQQLIVCFNALICVAEQIGNQVLLRLPVISNSAITVTFCSSYLTREACLEAFVGDKIHVLFSALVNCLITRCYESLTEYRAAWSVRKLLKIVCLNKRPKI